MYIGRFAPTPSGPLHQGSIVAALASFLDAKANNGRWLLRIEDLDPPREDPAASALIPKQLEAHGLTWDGSIQYQSQHNERYEAALDALRKSGDIFPCSCSRKQLQSSQGRHILPCTPNTTDVAWRLRVKDEIWGLDDRVFGRFEHNLKQSVGDFVLKRRDHFYAYQLAVVVDDHAAGINHIVRGLDLLDNTPRQLYLMQALGYGSHPVYLHLPLVLNRDGQKLSKQNQARAVDLNQIEDNLLQALASLGQPTPTEPLPREELLNWAISHWNPALIPDRKGGI